MSLDIAREVTAALAEAESVQAKGWKWRKGVVLFPETRCPYCREVVRSKAIWLIEGNSLIGQAVPRAGQPLVLDPPRHPHATPSDICMGNASDPLQALFTGLNPGSVYVNMIEWLQGKYWEHSCDAMPNEDEEEESHEHEDEFWCEGCEEVYDSSFQNSFDNRYYCDECFSERYFSCDSCDRTFSRDDLFSTEDGDESYCERCYNDKYFKCERCEGECSTDDRYESGNICCDCITWCSQCDENNDFEDGLRHCNVCDHNLCEGCAERHEHLLYVATQYELEQAGQQRLV